MSKWTKEGSHPFPFKSIFSYIIPFIERDSVRIEWGRKMKNQWTILFFLPLIKEYIFLRSLIIWSQAHKQHSLPYLGKHWKHYKLSTIVKSTVYLLREKRKKGSCSSVLATECYTEFQAGKNTRIDTALPFLFPRYLPLQMNKCDKNKNFFLILIAIINITGKKGETIISLCCVHVTV